MIDPEHGNPEQFVAELFELLDDQGRHHYEEAVSQLDHALQSAVLASDEHAPDELVVAALLHDVGYLIGGHANDSRRWLDADSRHEAIGEAFLGRAFAAGVTRPVGMHVLAKRYLISVDRGYAGRLSAASQRTLVAQGGPLTPAERIAFESSPFAQAAVSLRRWDDAAKVEGRIVPPLATFAPLAVQQARRHLAASRSSRPA